MFDLVADAERYPQFLPLCEALHIRGRQTMADGREILVADMTVAFKMVRETYTSRVVLDRAANRIDVAYLDGPFEHLDNRWTFRDLEDGACEVAFFIDYAFKSRTLSALMGAMFDKAFHKFSEAFAKRADEVYGRSA
jgi:coenzyme Q-binding protein COQ10